jgi:Pyridoxamine 5'-phosphate oxidase
MRRIVHEQRLGFCATVREDGSPNVSPRGTTTVSDEDRLLFDRHPLATSNHSILTACHLYARRHLRRWIHPAGSVRANACVTMTRVE